MIQQMEKPQQGGRNYKKNKVGVLALKSTINNIKFTRGSWQQTQDDKRISEFEYRATELSYLKKVGGDQRK